MLKTDTDDGLSSRVPRPLAVFCQKDAPANSFSWMVGARGAEQDLASEFISISMLEGPVAEEEIVALLPRIFPAIGQIYSARIVAQKDGNRALEVFEMFDQENQQKKGYQVISMVRIDRQLFFQRLAFYAEGPVFDNLVSSIQQSAHSFEYYRSYGLEQFPA